MSLRVSFLSFGCKLNQLETEALAEAFVAAGARLVPPASPEPIDLLVLNTCTVTAQAEARARRALRQAREVHPACLALATGCWAEVAPAEIAALGEGVLVLPGRLKAGILGLPAYLSSAQAQGGKLGEVLGQWLGEGASGPRPDPFSYRPESFARHSRPSLKVQEGCDNRCSYCRVSLARGPSVSLDPGLVLERLQGLEAGGAPEAVLTGVNLSQYRSGGLGFSGLLGRLLAGTSSIRLRLSSWEPDKVDPAFLEVFGEDRIRPHLHLALQSGSDSILAAMGRDYKGARVLAAVEGLRRAKADPHISADVIVGFPGEGEGEFRETLDLVREAGFGSLQVFPYSPRPGTPAAAFSGAVAAPVAEERRSRLAQFSLEARKAYGGRWLGKRVEAVVEGRDILAAGGLWRRATSENYLKLALSASGAPPRGTGLDLTLDNKAPPPGFDALAET